MGRTLFTPEICDFIKEHNTGRSAAEVAELVNAKYDKTFTPAQIKGHRARHHLKSGLTGYFEKGHTPHNKGKKTGSYLGMIPTQFKKGHTPHNHKPVGSERVTRDGYLERKIAEPNKWRAVHILNWEKVHGPVPKGHCVIFKNRDTKNPDIKNLLLVTRAELARMNQRALISTDPEYTQIGQNIAKIILAQAKRKKGVKR